MTTLHHDPLVRELLDVSRSLQLATIDRDGSPHLVTMWYGLLDDHTVVCWTPKDSRKAANLRHDPRLACLVEAGETYGELRGATIQARAELVEERSRMIDIGHAIIDRNFPAGERPEVPPLVDSGKRVGILIEPDAASTWDFRARTSSGPNP